MKYIIAIVSFLLGIVAAIFFVPLFTEKPVGVFRENAAVRTVLSATSVTASGTFSGVADYNLIGFTVSALSASGTVKFPCSLSDDAPSLLSVPSVTNQWGYASVVDLESGSVIAGNTGITFVNSSTVRQVAIQNSVFKHCTATFTASTGSVGSTTVKMLPTTAE